MGTLAPWHFAGKDTESETAKHRPDAETQHSAEPKICIYGDRVNEWSLGTAKDCGVCQLRAHKGKAHVSQSITIMTMTTHHVSPRLTLVKISLHSSFCMAPGMGHAHSLLH